MKVVAFNFPQSLLVDNRQKRAKMRPRKQANKKTLPWSKPIDRVELCTSSLRESVLTAAYYYYKIRFELGELYFLVWRGSQSLRILKKSGVAGKTLARSKPTDAIELWTSSLHESVRTVA